MCIAGCTSEDKVNSSLESVSGNYVNECFEFFKKNCVEFAIVCKSRAEHIEQFGMSHF